MYTSTCPPRPFRDQVYRPQIIVSSIVADVIIMEPSKVKTSTVFHEEYYQLDIATGYGFQKMVNTRFRTCQKRRKGSFRYLFRFICLLEN
jgi:hypothetical protein